MYLKETRSEWLYSYSWNVGASITPTASSACRYNTLKLILLIVITVTLNLAVNC